MGNLLLVRSRTMFRTFGQELLHFARAVDLVRDDDFREVRNLVKDYLAANFGVNKVEFLRETRIAGELGLAPQWDEGDTYGAYPLVRNGELNGQNALAFRTGDALWIIAKDQGVLADSTEYVDLWNHRIDIPRFVRFERQSDDQSGSSLRRETTRMLISVPIELRQQIVGVLYCESDDVYVPNEAAKQEYLALAGSIGILYKLRRDGEATHQNTRAAMAELRRTADEPVEFRVTKPRLYLAYGHEKDPEVLGPIRQTLERYKEKIEIRDWGTDQPPGDIPTWITSEIIAAQYLVSYLSERIEDEGEGISFRDNPNVIFETGMFHALRESTAITARQWLPIREGAPEEAPFDFRGMRMVVVPRDGEGRLDEDRFKTVLGRSIRELLADLSPKM
jgi:hypothetical protein